MQKSALTSLSNMGFSGFMGSFFLITEERTCLWWEIFATGGILCEFHKASSPGPPDAKGV